VHGVKLSFTSQAQLGAHTQKRLSTSHCLQPVARRRGLTARPRTTSTAAE
jgi:hypothetical protein